MRAQTVVSIEPSQVVAELDGSHTELYEIPLRVGTWAFDPGKVIRLDQIRERSPEELGALLGLCRDLFVEHWEEIVFGVCIEGAVFELKLPAAPRGFSMLDGYLTVEIPPGPAHFHLCLAETRGLGKNKTPEALASRRRCSRAVFYRTLNAAGCSPGSWGIRLWNGAGEQMLTVFLPSPFVNREMKRSKPDWTRLSLWNELRARYLGERTPQPLPEQALAELHA